MPTPKRGRKPGTGEPERLPSGRYRVRVTGPDGARHAAPITFQDKRAARLWLDAEARLMESDPLAWRPPRERLRAQQQAAEAAHMPTFTEYATRWIKERRVNGKPLADRTQDHYSDLLRDYIAPTFGDLPLDAIEPGAVNLWFDALKVRRKRKGDTGETTKAHTYALARAVMNTATSAHGPLVGRVNPFAVRGGGRVRTGQRTQLATSGEVATMLEVIRPEWRAILLLGLWTGLRFGEIAALRRSDVDLKRGVLRVERSVARSRVAGVREKDPKSLAGKRDMHVPAVVVEELRTHMRRYVTGRDGLLFPGTGGQYLAPSTFYGKATCKTCKLVPSACARARKDGKTEAHEFKPRESGWYAARAAAGRNDLHFHDLRATGATLMAQNGATEAEIQAFLGDSTPEAAKRYVRAARSRMKAHAERMNELATGGAW